MVIRSSQDPNWRNWQIHAYLKKGRKPQTRSKDKVRNQQVRSAVLRGHSEHAVRLD